MRKSGGGGAVLRKAVEGFQTWKQGRIRSWSGTEEGGGCGVSRGERSEGSWKGMRASCR